jgi:CMP-N-acetylneuraminic acid synthetase
MRVLGLIPARGGSKGVPRKNIKLLCGKPLIQYTIAPALSSGLFAEIIVSTDDQEIAEASKNLGATPMSRPSHLATDNSPTIDTVVHVLQKCLAEGNPFDAVCLLQPTNPLRSVDLLKRSLEKFEQSGADSLISVRQVPHEYNPHWVFEAGADNSFLTIATGEKNIIPRRQELPVAYHRDGAVYLVKSKVVLEQKSLYGEKVDFIDVSGEAHVNIDTPDDWVKAEKYLCAE